jgi:hypothetical protein
MKRTLALADGRAGGGASAIIGAVEWLAFCLAAVETFRRRPKLSRGRRVEDLFHRLKRVR